MVAGNDDARQTWPPLMDVIHGAIERAARLGPRRHAVKNIACNNQGIDLSLAHDALDLGQNRGMLVAPRPPLESAPICQSPE
jgi:hypothetical protein